MHLNFGLLFLSFFLFYKLPPMLRFYALVPRVFGVLLLQVYCNIVWFLTTLKHGYGPTQGQGGGITNEWVVNGIITNILNYDCIYSYNSLENETVGGGCTIISSGIDIFGD